MNCRVCLVTSTVILASLGFATSARAEIVFLSSNRTISVKGHRVEGDSIVLVLRNGGEVTCDKSIITKIISDEVPYPDPAAVAAQAAQSAQAEEPPASPGTVLESTPYGEIISAIS